MTVCSIDFETRSVVDLKTCGAWRYFEDDSADVLCAAYAFDDGEVRTWRRDRSNSRECPDDLRAHIEAGGVLSAWNATFEAWAFLHVLGPRHGWPVPKASQWRDTMAQAAAMSLPQALAHCAAALGLDMQKDKAGDALIRKFSIPAKPVKGKHAHELPGKLWNEPEDHPEAFQRFVDYCAQDVRVERAARNQLMALTPAMQRVWEMTYEMNTRGVHLDMPLVDALSRVAEVTKGRLDKEMAAATGFAVGACSQVAAMLTWLGKQGVETDNLDKNAIGALLDRDDLPPVARRVVEIRKEYAKTSTAKLNAMRACVGRDSRAHGLHLYHGAGTGRWSGRLVQTQNMPRGTGTVKHPEAAAEDMLTGDAAWVDLIYGNPMSAVSDMLRACLTATPGSRLLAADYSSIEGRVTAWLAGETWKLEAFRANDRNEGPGAYEMAASGIFNVPAAKVTKPQRQVGKVAELALGFEGGVMAFHAMAAVYRTDMAPVFPILHEITEPELWMRAEKRYDECLGRNDTGTDVMSREAWIASEVTKVQWRAKHPATVALWRGLEDAARGAVLNPGAIHTYGRISYVVKKGFLWCRLPSSRCLAYGAPKIEDRKTPWGDTKASITAMGVDSVTKRWMRTALYGGLLTENAVQAVAADLMKHGMMTAEAGGYAPVMTVHDEGVTDMPEGQGSLAEFERMLCDVPSWGAGLPLVASGYEAFRYRKD